MEGTWLFASGMMRSGSVLQWALASEVLWATGVGDSLGNARNRQRFQSVWKSNLDHRGLKLLKHHYVEPEIQSAYDAGKVTILYTYRDIRDVVVSFDQYVRRVHSNRGEPAPPSMDEKISSGSLATFINFRLKEFDYYHPRAQVSIQYETGISNIEIHLISIAEALEVSLPRHEIDRIVTTYSTESVLSGHAALIGSNHIQRARINRWKEELTTAQVRYIESIAGDWLVAQGYTLSTETGGIL